MPPFYAYICFSPEDEPLASVTCGTLERAGIRCWFATRDVNTIKGDSLSLINIIDHCGVLVLIVSEHTSNSPEITDQVQRSVKNRTPIIPVRIGNLAEADLAKLFADVHLLGWLNGTVPAFQEEIVSRVNQSHSEENFEV